MLRLLSTDYRYINNVMQLTIALSCRLTFVLITSASHCDTVVSSAEEDSVIVCSKVVEGYLRGLEKWYLRMFIFSMLQVQKRRV